MPKLQLCPLDSYETGLFDVVLANKVSPDAALLAIVLKVLKPQGKVVISSSSAVDLENVLLFAGFKNPSKSLENGKFLENDETFGIFWNVHNYKYYFIEIIAEKPNYEVGSSAKLSFAKSSVDKAKVAAVWKIDNDDDEIIDADELLDEEDLATPDPASLRGNII